MLLVLSSCTSIPVIVIKIIFRSNRISPKTKRDRGESGFVSESYQLWTEL